MKPIFRIAIAVAAVLIVGFVLWKAWGPRPDSEARLTGSVEADTLYLSSPAAGAVAEVFVADGQSVPAGAPLFAMDPATLSAVEGQAQARVAVAQAQIGTAAARASQSQASVAAARAQEAEARRTLARFLSLRRDNPAAVAGREIDQARAAADNAAAQRLAAERAVMVQTQDIAGARAAEIQARQGLAEQRARLGQLSQAAPVAGRVEQVFFQRGEWAGGQPAGRGPAPRRPGQAALLRARGASWPPTARPRRALRLRRLRRRPRPRRSPTSARGRNSPRR